MMTKGEFIDAIADLLEDYGCAYMDRQEARSISIDSWAREAQERMDTAEDGLLAAYDEMTGRIAELEAACERALEGLRAPTHAANDHNCEDWPPGQGCRGCDGNELRKTVAGEIAALLRGER